MSVFSVELGPLVDEGTMENATGLEGGEDEETLCGPRWLYSTPNLHLSAWNGNWVEAAEILRVAGRCVVNVGDSDGHTALHLSAWSGQVGVAKVLLAFGADLEVRDRLGQTPLHLAAEFNQEGALRFLLDSRAAVDAKDRQGRTPLSLAARYV